MQNATQSCCLLLKLRLDFLNIIFEFFFSLGPTRLIEDTNAWIGMMASLLILIGSRAVMSTTR
jgi:hypothetical protein